MRVCARVALISASVSACFGLAGCAAIDELRDTILRWVESEKLPSERGVFAPDATPAVSPEKPPKKEASKDIKEAGQISAQTATAADRCESSKETTDYRFP
jgi:hypothetical protein